MIPEYIKNAQNSVIKKPNRKVHKICERHFTKKNMDGKETQDTQHN